MIGLVVSIQANRSRRILACGFALARTLESVAYRVTHNMRERLGNGVEQPFIEIRLLTAQYQTNLFVAFFGRVSHHARKASKQLFDRNHAYLHHRPLQVVEHARLETHGIGKLRPQRILGIAPRKFD